MAVKVGEGYIDVETRLDSDSFVKASKAMAQRAGLVWGKSYNENIQRAFRDADQQFDVHVNKQISSFQSLERQRIRAAEDTQRRLTKIYNDISAQTERDHRLSDAFAKEGARAAKAFEDEHNASFGRILQSYRKGLSSLDDDVDVHSHRWSRSVGNFFLRAFKDVDVNVDHHGHTWARTLEHNLSRGLDAFMSILPGRMESLFSGRGGPIGLAIGGAIIGGVAFALPALGAMLSGAAFATLGLGSAIAAAFVAAADDPRVSDAANRLAQKFKDKVIYDPSIQFLGQVLADQLDKVTEALNRWAPHIQGILKAGASFMPGIFDAFIGGMDRLLPVLSNLTNSQFMQNLMNIANSGIVKVFDAIATSFERFLGDAKAMRGAELGWEDFWNLIAGAIKTAFDWLRALSRLWADMNTDPDGPGSLLSPMDKLRQIWKDIKDDLTSIGKAFQDNFGPGSPFDKFNKDSQEAKNIWQDISAIWEGMHGRQQGTPTMDIGGARDFNAEGAGLGSADPNDFWKNQWDDIRGEAKIAWSNIVGQIKTTFKEKWAEFKTSWSEETKIWIEAHNKIAEGIKSDWHDIWTDIKDSFVVKWHEFTTVWSEEWLAWKNAYDATLGGIKDAWNATWQFVKDFFAQKWNELVQTLTEELAIWQGIWNGFLEWIKSLWNAVWQWVKDFFVQKWNEAVQALLEEIAIWQGVWNGFTEWIKGIWNAAWQSVKDTFIGKFNEAKQALIQEIAIWAGIWNGFLTALQTAWDSIWQGMLVTLGTVWNNIKDAVLTGINAVITVLNNGIRGINTVLEKLGIDFRISEISPAGNTPAVRVGGSPDGGRASGGIMGRGKVYGPGTETSDSIFTKYRTGGLGPMVSRNEYVINARSAKKLGYQNLDWLNRTGSWGLAAGGRVDSGNESLLQQHADHLHVAMEAGYQAVIAAAAASGIPFTVGSTVRPGDRGSSGGLSWHHYGKAVDFMGENQDALAAYFENLPGVIEEIHRSGSRDYAIFGKGGSKVGALINEFMSKGIDWVMEHMLNPVFNQMTGGMPNSVPGAIGKGTVKGLAGGLKKKVEEAITKAREAFTAFSVAGGGGGAAQWSGVASQALGMLGLPSSWLGPLLTLIGRESGGNPNAVNRTDSNAARGTPSMGLMQTIGPTFAAHMFPGFSNILAPLDNILAGLRYIIATYGSIFSVQQAVGSTPRGYDAGGMLQPGLSLAYNGTGSPEPVLTGSQWDDISNGGQNITVLVDGVEVLARKIVETNNSKVYQAIRRGKRG